MADNTHGLKDLFGSVPDPDAEPVRPASGRAAPSPPASGTPAPDGQAPSPPPVRPSPVPAPPVPTPDGRSPTLDAPNLAPLPPGFAAESLTAPSAPVRPAPAFPGAGAAPGAALGAAGLSCIVVARGGAAAAARTLHALRAQTVAEGLDLVVVTDEPVQTRADGFASVRDVRARGGASYGEMAAAGLEAARGDLVALLDDYAFPARDWAETILTHRHDRFAALGSALANANPRSRLSWGNMLMEYGDWRHGLAGGTVDRLPTRNLVYRREALTGLGASLPGLLDEGKAARALADQGLPMKLQDEARLSVLNPSTLPATIRSRFAKGRLDAAGWSRGQSPLKRAGKAAKASFGGWARYQRDKSKVFLGSDPSVNPKLQGRAVLIGMMAEGLGRAAGYLKGPGQAARTRDRLTAQRSAWLNKVDRKQFTR